VFHLDVSPERSGMRQKVRNSRWQRIAKKRWELELHFRFPKSRDNPNSATPSTSRSFQYRLECKIESSRVDNVLPHFPRACHRSTSSSEGGGERRTPHHNKTPALGSIGRLRVSGEENERNCSIRRV
jgi:hypothetical protein